MQLDHERLDVYELALEFVVQANGIIEGMRRGRSHWADQFTRASLSIVLNLAEGAGKHGRLDKRRYYLTARGSARESAALLDVCLRLTPPWKARTARAAARARTPAYQQKRRRFFTHHRARSRSRNREFRDRP